MAKAVFFDLDGTLLPMEQDAFVARYLSLLSEKLATFGIPRELTAKALWRGVGAMVKNNGTQANIDAFNKTFADALAPYERPNDRVFNDFYESDFDEVQKVCGFSPCAREVLDLLKKKGISAVLATNPVFPAVATEHRMAWAGLSPSDFVYFTTAENSHFCKPNIAYYKEILEKLNLNAEDCIMVGNDIREDMIAGTLGMKCFLLTDCLIGDENDVCRYAHGNFDALLSYLNAVKEIDP